MSIKYMGDEKSSFTRENRYFQNNTDIKNCFPITYKNYPKTYYK